MPDKYTQLIETMPTFLGKQFYPLGFPLHFTQLTYKAKPLHEILFQQEPTTEQERIRKDYYLYWLWAPIWNIPQEDRNIGAMLNSYELLNLLFDNGIDPL